MRSRIVIFAMGLVLVTSFSATAQEMIGKPIANFASQDYLGAEFQLDDVDSKAKVIAFLGTECPLVINYGPVLEKIASDFAGDGVEVIGVNSNTHDSLEDIDTFVKNSEVSFKMLKDAGNKVADLFQATRTPEVFLLDSNNVVRYQGRIDDQYGVGVSRASATRYDLRTAIKELLAGKAVTTPFVEPEGCLIGRVRAPKENADVTYCNQVVRILQNRCVSCHRSGEIGPFSLKKYDEVAGWAEMIDEVVQSERMPPWNASPEHGEFSNSNHLTQEEKDTIAAWVKSGAPKGDEADLPTEPQFVNGWQLPRSPDYRCFVSKRPFRVQATGFMQYKYFDVDPKFTEDKWIVAAQLKPSNHRVVHHILALIVPPGDEGGGFDETDGFLVGYVPGLIAQPLPKGMAKKIPAGSKLVFQVHYTPIGTEQFDQSELGLVFADDEEQITHEVVTTSGVGRKINIPPNTDNHPMTAISHRPLGGSKLLGLMPHMHLRGKSFRYEYEFPNGETGILLDVPKYDFNWQFSYRLKEPIDLPEGATIKSFATFDNSKKNRNNPNPNARVKWGDQTYEEMMIGYFDIAIPIGDELLNYSQDELMEGQFIIRRFDANKDGKVEKSEVSRRVRARFDDFDRDGDGVITAREAVWAVSQN